LFGSGPGGGGGGGGVELGATSFITLAGDSLLSAAGAEFRDGLAVNAGGGSGGGVLLHAPSITLLSGFKPARIDASGFSGGRIALLTSDATVAGNTSGLSVGANFYGHVGVISYGQLSLVPEPASGLLMAAGLAAVWSSLRAGRRRTPA
jgi:hypothetical protein